MNTKSKVYLSVVASNTSLEAQQCVEILGRMYVRFCDLMKWEYIVVSHTFSEEGGLSDHMMEISGDSDDLDIFASMENGYHSIARRPEHDPQLRKHTTYTMVRILKEAPGEFTVEVKDFKVDSYRSSGAVGQTVRVDSAYNAVRITHLTSGVSVYSNYSKSLIQNRILAFGYMRALLFQAGGSLEYVGKPGEVDPLHPFKGSKEDLERGPVRTYDVASDWVRYNGKEVFGLTKKILDGWMYPFWPEVEEADRLMKELVADKKLTDVKFFRLPGYSPRQYASDISMVLRAIRDGHVKPMPAIGDTQLSRGDDDADEPAPTPVVKTVPTNVERALSYLSIPGYWREDAKPIGEFYSGFTAEESEALNWMYHGKDRIKAAAQALGYSNRSVQVPAEVIEASEYMLRLFDSPGYARSRAKILNEWLKSLGEQ